MEKSAKSRREKLVEDIENVMVSSLLDRLSTIEFNLEEFKKFFLSLRYESDRAIVIVSFSYIDKTIEELMKKQMNPQISGGQDSLFKISGPLATSSARINIAAGLYWISSNSYQGLEILRKIRNEFAHKPFLIGFEDKKIIGYLSTLASLFPGIESRILEGLDDGDIGKEDISNRLLFHIRSLLICQQMVRELLTAPTSIKMGLGSFAALNPKVDWDKQPKVLRDILIGTVDVIEDLLKKNPDLKRHNS